jgi:5'(3')-deoxyribonucleotidase
MKKPRVGVDVDGVLGDLLTPCFTIAAEMFGKTFTIDDLTSWDLDSIIPKDRLDEFWQKLGEPGICRNLKPYHGAIDGMRMLGEVADVFLVTSHLHGSPQWVYEREQWAHEHFGIDRHKIVHTKSKHIFAGKMLIDDKPKNIEEWAEEHPLGIPVLWHQPYNHHMFTRKLAPRVFRTNSWELVSSVVRAMTISI